MIITNTFTTTDPAARAARQATICRRCILLLTSRTQG